MVKKIDFRARLKGPYNDTAAPTVTSVTTSIDAEYSLNASLALITPSPRRRHSLGVRGRRRRIHMRIAD